MTRPFSIALALADTQAALEPLAGEDAAFEARQLVAAVTGFEACALSARREATLDEAARERLCALLRERRSGRPLQYVLGEWEFMGLRFYTDARALIPRQDTETLVECALDFIKRGRVRTCLDLCCGSGCIGIALAKLTGIETTLADISADALALARENAKLNAVEVRFVKTDMFDGLCGERFDIVLCNPPYLTREEMASLQREVRFEPANALFGGEDGLDFYRKLSREAMAHINPGGALFMETGHEQAQAVGALFDNRWIARDLCGVERVVRVERR